MSLSTTTEGVSASGCFVLVEGRGENFNCDLVASADARFFGITTKCILRQTDDLVSGIDAE